MLENVEVLEYNQAVMDVVVTGKPKPEVTW